MLESRERLQLWHSRSAHSGEKSTLAVGFGNNCMTMQRNPMRLDVLGLLPALEQDTDSFDGALPMSLIMSLLSSRV